MNYLVFSPYYPPHIGGLENHAKEFNINMAKRGHAIIVYTPQIPRNTPQLDSTEKNIKIIRFPAFELIPGYPIPKFWQHKFWYQWNELQQERCDFVISRTRFFLTSIMALWYSKAHRIKYIHIEHGSDFVQLDSRILSAIAKIYDHTIGRYVFSAADTVIANSEASAEFVKKITYSKIVPKVIYRGIEMGPGPHKRVCPTMADPVILYVGRLIDGKGVQDLIQALTRIQEKKWVTWIVGDGPYGKKLRDTVYRLNLDSRIIFLGEQSHTEALKYIESADIVINPSYTEGIPSTIIEAARAGKAIIATSVGGTPEVIEHKETGLLYTPKDLDTLKRYITLFIDSSTMRDDFGRKARSSMRGKFSWEQAMIQYEYVWNNR